MLTWSSSRSSKQSNLSQETLQPGSARSRLGSRLSEQAGMPAIIPIPGVTTADRVKENATVVEISAEGMKEIDKISSRAEIVGDRYLLGA